MQANFIDTHCHYNHDQFAGEIHETIDRAAEAGVRTQIVVGFDLPSSQLAVEIAEAHPGVYASVGIHPHDAGSYNLSVEQSLIDLLEHPKVVAIGEIGLDHYRNICDPESQHLALHSQLKLALSKDMPVIFHCREAYEELLTRLEEPEMRGIRGVMHCWAGGLNEVKRTVDLGLYLGFGGVLTFRNAQLTRDCFLAAPIDHILLETDAPYLAPVPYRGKRNEPAYLTEVAATAAHISNRTIEEIAVITTENAKTLFGISIS